MNKNFLQEWQILRRGRRVDFAIIIAISAIFLFVIALNVLSCRKSPPYVKLGYNSHNQRQARHYE